MVGIAGCRAECRKYPAIPATTARRSVGCTSWPSGCAANVAAAQAPPRARRAGSALTVTGSHTSRTPCMTTLGRSIARSSHAAPRDAYGQSTRYTFSGVSSTLSARRSPCTKDSPSHATSAPRSASASASRCAAAQGTSVARPGSGCARRARQPVAMSAKSGPVGGRRIARAPGTDATRTSAASTRSSSCGSHGVPGERPSTASYASATQSPSPWPQAKRGAGTARGSRVATFASARCRSAATGSSAVRAALTKRRVPSSSVRTDASPGLNPAGTDRSCTTLPPATASSSSRSASGRSAQSRRRPPEATGTSPAASTAGGATSSGIERPLPLSVAGRSRPRHVPVPRRRVARDGGPATGRAPGDGRA